MKPREPGTLTTERELNSRRRIMLDRRRMAFGSELEHWDYTDWLEAARHIDHLLPGLDVAS